MIFQKVLEATSAEAALELFRRYEIDLVITDHLLPALAGTELARRMKQLKPRMPIALLTGLPEPPDGAQHAECYITKGEGLQSVFRRISDLIRSQPKASRASATQPRQMSLTAFLLDQHRARFGGFDSGSSTGASGVVIGFSGGSLMGCGGASSGGSGGSFLSRFAMMCLIYPRWFFTFALT